MTVLQNIDYSLTELFVSSHANILVVIVLIGLIIGSFINVVAHRTPIIMMQEWRQEINEFIAQDDSINVERITEHSQAERKLSLSYPSSHCTACHHSLAWWQNIPILSFFILSGRCAYCHAKISPSYLIVELITALLSLLVVWCIGMNLQAIFALVLVWYLLTLSLIDIKVQLLPDRLLVPVGIIGLIANIYGSFTTLTLAVWGLVIGFVSFWFINTFFKLMTKKDGLGLGDAKLLSVLGAWLGVHVLPMVVFIAALLGVIIGSILGKKNQAFAFGPYLSIGGIIALLWGEQLWAWYAIGF
ncbi:prepilin peptidase [Moraxella sp. Tifton1]|uniref:prepilin peptidase n=1 Tax=Moraxella oculi TaxID=2940516 RepID=UPI002012F51D|nr:A24 family peptidase [Moraxella sp. Tifton1]MCL1623481.1 prepilin peptidase [Moraxella sp. Tifton1]